MLVMSTSSAKNAVEEYENQANIGESVWNGKSKLVIMRALFLW